MSEYEVKEKDISSKSEIQARRETRRRNILENSKLRLEKLNGKISNESTTENTPLNNSHRTFSDPEMETEEMFVGNKSNFANTFIKQDVFDDREQDLLNQKLFFRNLQFQHQNETQNMDENINNLFRQEQNQSSTVVKKESLMTKILKSKFHLIVLSIFTYGVVVFGDKYFSNYSIFLPLLVWELTETIIIRPKDNSSEALFNLVLLMVGVPSNISQPFLKVTHTLNRIFKDVGVFVFSFVICHVIYIGCTANGTDYKLYSAEEKHLH